MRRLISPLVATLLLTGPLGAQAASSKWVGDAAEVSYRVVHKFHEVLGISKAVEVVAQLDDGGLKVMARAPIKSFDSGNQNRDAHVLEVVDAPHFPDVTVRALAPAAKLPDSPGTVALPLELSVELHGVRTTRKVTAQVVLRDLQHATLTFDFDDSLTAHGIERPSLLFVAVDDALHIAGKISLHRQ